MRLQQARSQTAFIPITPLWQKLLLLLTLISFCLALMTVDADARERKKQRQAEPPRYAALLIDAESGKILHQENASARRHPASLTKMMTLYMVFQALESGKLTLDQRLLVSPQAASQSPSKLGLRPGQRITVEDVILGLVTQSANDAAVVAAEALGGSEARFAQMMTATAKQLGMHDTIYKNASGLPNPQQITNARDQAKLALALQRHYPQFYHYFSTASFEYNGTVHNNHNRLMARYEGMDGIKTGFIRASGFNLVASVNRDGKRIIGVIFGGRSASSRDTQLAKLLDASFEKIEKLPRVQTASAIALKADQLKTAPVPQRKPVELTAADMGIEQGSNGAYADQIQQAGFTPAMADNSLPPAAAEAAVTRAAVQAAIAEAPKNGWGIQVGAYNDRASGQRALALLADQNRELLGRAAPRVLAVTTERGTIFRARLIGLTEQQARLACRELQKQSRACLTLPPAGAPSAWLASAE